MKKMIISPAQLKAINEAAAVTYARSSAPSDITSAVNGMVGKTTSNEFQVKIPGNNGPAMATTLPDLQSGTETISPETSQVNVTADPTKTAMTETKYSKRQVELGRMLEMRRTGKVFSKKQLNEMFMESQENMQRLQDCIGNCRFYDIMLAIGENFGPEAEDEVRNAFANGQNVNEVLKRIFGAASPEEQEEFLDDLGI